MAETTGALSEAVHQLLERARTSMMPIAALIGFDVEEIVTGRAVASLQTGPQHANPWALHGECCATWLTRRNTRRTLPPKVR
jgi:acyl-coenzyme A thioesterase PaaI-like protein